MKKNQKNKRCPFLDESCLRDRCQIYNEVLNNCEVSVLTYNMYKLATAINSNKPGTIEDLRQNFGG